MKSAKRQLDAKPRRERNRVEPLSNVFDRLLAHFGPQLWWPAWSRDEVAIGAILAQNTAWSNAERAIERLRDADCLRLARLERLTDDALADLIRPSGTHRIKAARLKNLANTLRTRFDGSWDVLLGQGLPAARDALLQVSGIGPETADAILLYGGGLPTFVIDAYTRRMMRRHGWEQEAATYDLAKQFFEATLSPNADMFAEYHALLVALGKTFCRPTANCEGCPLETLPHDPKR